MAITNAAAVSKLISEGSAYSNPYAGYVGRNTDLDVVKSRANTSQSLSGGVKESINERIDCIKQNSQQLAEHVDTTIKDIAKTVPETIAYAENYLQGDSAQDTLGNACELMEKAYGIVNDSLLNRGWDSVGGAVNELMELTDQLSWEEQADKAIDILTQSCDTSDEWIQKIRDELSIRGRIQTVLTTLQDAYAALITHPCAQAFIHRVATPEMRQAIYAPEIAIEDSQFILDNVADIQNNPGDFIKDPSKRAAIDFNPLDNPGLDIL